MTVRREILSILAQTFNDVQKTNVNHQRNAAALRKYQVQCYRNSCEQEFNKMFVQCATQILPVKKKEPCVKNVVEFIATFICHCREKGISIWVK